MDVECAITKSTDSSMLIEFTAMTATGFRWKITWGHWCPRDRSIGQSQSNESDSRADRRVFFARRKSNIYRSRSIRQPFTYCYFVFFFFSSFVNVFRRNVSSTLYRQMLIHWHLTALKAFFLSDHLALPWSEYVSRALCAHLTLLINIASNSKEKYLTKMEEANEAANCKLQMSVSDFN